MGRIQSGKAVKDIESAEESFVLNLPVSNRSKKNSDTSSIMTVSAQFQSNQDFGDFTRKK